MATKSNQSHLCYLPLTGEKRDPITLPEEQLNTDSEVSSKSFLCFMD